VDIGRTSERVNRAVERMNAIRAEVARVIVGQEYMVDRLLIGLLADGHLLLEGVPGLAKTLAVRTLAGALSLKFRRIQFTPDLLPADLTGTLIFNPRDSTFTTKHGPVFANLILADEINRAPAKVQSALLEAMQEKQVTLGESTYPLEEPFLVLATQNPIEHEGTYPLPEAQVDRFMLKLHVSYPNRGEEREIITRMSGTGIPTVRRVVSPSTILRAREIVAGLYVDPKVVEYVLDLVEATRYPAKSRLDELKPLIAFGASPRAGIFLTKASKAHAFLRGRAYVVPDDVKAIAHDVLRHRLILTYEAEAEAVDTEDLIDRILDKLNVP
jgi:MoxR-like ATPase